MESDAGVEARLGRDLVVLVADGTMGATCRGLLSRPEALGIRSVTSEIVPHPERDPGVYHRAPEFLRAFRNRHRHAMVLLDHHGCGQEETSRRDLEENLEGRLASDWGGDRCAAIVIAPELEAWVWSDSPHVADILGWKGTRSDLDSWLSHEGYLDAGRAKPARPKRAVEEALRVARKPRSSVLYRQLAERVSLRRCRDASFLRFCRVLRRWFPPAG